MEIKFIDFEESNTKQSEWDVQDNASKMLVGENLFRESPWDISKMIAGVNMIGKVQHCYVDDTRSFDWSGSDEFDIPDISKMLGDL